jgi:hypothetical protein
MESTLSITPWYKNESGPSNRRWLMGWLLEYEKNAETCWIESKRFV